ncbi:MAG: hypothetical protein HY744_34770 [Deltaproteobacteria bacterium]|nr:hypothetical protein [Deltaproteobacteria bacterium]
MEIEELLEALRADLEGTMLSQSQKTGWPVPVGSGYLFVSTLPGLDLLAGDHDGWAGTPMNADDGFAWLFAGVEQGTRYKLTDGVKWEPDPWSRAYLYDEYGLMSAVEPAGAHFERHFAVEGGAMQPRTVRVWIPPGPATHVLYVEDGQNLFDPEAPWGSWKLQDSAPEAMMIVGIDNTPARMDEYTHVQDLIDGELCGGDGDSYADLVQQVVRGLVKQQYGEPGRVGLMGSSLGGLISFHIADRYPGEYDFAASLSGTMGWGSIGLSDGAQNETMIERYAKHGHQGTALYLDSGGGGTCYDADGDDIEDDDPEAEDNYCENRQLEQVLQEAGYVPDTDLWHWWEPDAEHNEAAWAARVWRPLEIFAGM